MPVFNVILEGGNQFIKTTNKCERSKFPTMYLISGAERTGELVWIRESKMKDRFRWHVHRWDIGNGERNFSCAVGPARLIRASFSHPLLATDTRTIPTRSGHRLRLYGPRFDRTQYRTIPVCTDSI